MSQGGSAPRPASRHSSRSPARATETTSSPPLHRSRTQRDDQRPRPPRDPGGVALIHGDGTSQETGTSISATRSILNPAGAQGGVAEHFPSFTQHSVTGGHALLMEAGQHEREASPSRPVRYENPGSTTPQSAIPSTASPAGQPTPGDRGSPHGVHPYPTAARRILTPRSPRAASLSRAAMRTVDAQHLTTNLPASASRGAIPSHEPQPHGTGPSPLGTPPQLYSSGSAQGQLEPSPTRPTSGLARSLSHPSLSHGLPPAPHPEPPPQQPAGLKRERSGRPVLSGPPFAAPLPATQPFGTSGILGDTRWGSGFLSSASGGAARDLSITEGQPVLTITPSHGEEIVVPVDVHQGSKVADQKRQRNAGASARFRQRKKERERSQQEELQKLENANRELENRNEELARRCQELEAEREFYRNDRNRLRDVLSRLPGGQEWADRGPPSPISRSAGAPFASSSSAPLLAPQPPPPPAPGPSQPQHYPSPFPPPLTNPLSYSHPRSSSYADASTLEPPARRRRTDSEPQLPTNSYSLMAPAPLPPITSAVPPPLPPPPPLASSSFGTAPPPHATPPPPLNPRLPPLRFDQASRTPSTTPPPVPVPPPPAIPSQTTTATGSPYVTTRRLPYETGWATDPRPSEPEGGGPR